MTKKVLMLVLWNSCVFGKIQKQFFSYFQEELVNDRTFTHEITIENRTKKERYTIGTKEVPSDVFEEQLYQAKKEEHKRKRQQRQEEQLKLHEAYYKGTVKIGQKELTSVLAELDRELNRLTDERLKPFLLFSSPVLSSEQELMELKEEQLPHAKALCDLTASSLDIDTLTTTLESMEKAVAATKETFLETVNNALEKADDTKLLKELLMLMEPFSTKTTL